MDNINNSDQNVSDSIAAAGVIAYHAMFMVITVPMIIINFIVMHAILLEKSVSKQIRIVLVNTPIACNIVAIDLFLNQVLSIIGTTTGVNPPKALCQFVLVMFRVGGMYRLAFMALYSITVFLIVRFKATTLKPLFMIIAVASVWLLVCFFGMWYLLTFDVINGQVSRCVPYPTSDAGIAFVVVYSALFALLCFVITLTIPFITMCYIKRHTITTDSRIALALAKFALFLLFGNSINVLSEILPAILASTVVGNTSFTILGIVSMVVLAVLVVSVIPPPVLILVYFKHIRNRAFPCLQKKSASESTTSSSFKKTQSGSTLML